MTSCYLICAICSVINGALCLQWAPINPIKASRDKKERNIQIRGAIASFVILFICFAMLTLDFGYIKDFYFGC